MSIVQTNISNWTPYEVCEWLKGLEEVSKFRSYIQKFIIYNVNGKQLLDLTHSDLDKLSVKKIGHQELIIQAIQLLNSLQNDLEDENIQHLALKVRCKAISLENEVKIRHKEDRLLVKCELQRIDSPSLSRSNKQYKRKDEQNKGDFEKIKLAIPVLSAISDIVESIKVLINWLDRSPFDSIEDFIKKRKQICTIGIQLITAARGDNYHFTPKYLGDNLSELIGHCNQIIREFNDPLILMGPTLEIATIRKLQDQQLAIYGGSYFKINKVLTRQDSEEREDHLENIIYIGYKTDLGIHIQSTHYGTHMIEAVKDKSPAQMSGKLEYGDELIQVNNQLIVGWSLPKLVELLQKEQDNINVKEIKLTVKKRPKLLQSRRTHNARLLKNIGGATLPKRSTERLRAPLSSSSLSPADDNDEVFDTETPNTCMDSNLSAIEKQRRATVSGGSPNRLNSEDSSPDSKLSKKKYEDIIEDGTPKLLRMNKINSIRRNEEHHSDG